MEDEESVKLSMACVLLNDEGFLWDDVPLWLQELIQKLYDEGFRKR